MYTFSTLQKTMISLTTFFLLCNLALGQRSMMTMNMAMHHSSEEVYQCVSMELEYNKTQYIVKFEPKVFSQNIHHMILYGCNYPGFTKSAWICDESMTNFYDNGSMKASKSVCLENPVILYAWAKNAPTLVLPYGVGFKIGAGAGIQHLVLQVHYANSDSLKTPQDPDVGVNVYVINQRPLRQAGIITLMTGGRINPWTLESMEVSCVIQEDKVIHPFAFRTHTHSLGVLVSGYKVVHKHNKEDKWILIGQHSPQDKQMFYPVQNNVTIGKGDVIAANCFMYNNQDRTVYIGSTSKDEMCNFYLMYWTEGEPLDTQYCFSKGPPFYYWYHDLKNIPNKTDQNLSWF